MHPTRALAAALTAAALAVPTTALAVDLAGPGDPVGPATSSTHDSWFSRVTDRSSATPRTISIAAAPTSQSQVARPLPSRGQLAPDVFAEVLSGRLFVLDANPTADALVGGVPCGVDASHGCVYGRAASVRGHSRP